MEQTNTKQRPPIVAILGHVDHGKSTLLDYIRKANTVAKEAGGITQHIGAYEIETKDESGTDCQITFIDTPGHAAFGKMRERGAALADVAVLVVAADDGVKPQTLEALEAIKLSNIPFIVAINKIDKPDADVIRAKQSLAEAGVFVEGYGGTVPVAEISAKSGQGVAALLSLILLQASLEERPISNKCEAVIVESHKDARRGTLATLIVTNGSIKMGDHLATAQGVAVVRMMQDCIGKIIDSAEAGTPVQIAGFESLPEVGSRVSVHESKREAQEAASSNHKVVKQGVIETGVKNGDGSEVETTRELNVALVLKADTTGTLEAIVAELKKRENEKITVKIMAALVGEVVESDVKLALGSDKPLIVAFNVHTDRHARDLADKNAVMIEDFDVIYKLTEWFDEYIEQWRPKQVIETVTGEARVLKTFSRTRTRQVLGGRVVIGKLGVGKRVRIGRAGETLGEGKIVNLQRSRADVSEVSESEQFGLVIESKLTVAEGDDLQIISNS